MPASDLKWADLDPTGAPGVKIADLWGNHTKGAYGAFFKLPAGMNFGEVSGVAVNSRGHVFVFTRSNSASGPAYAPTAAQLLEFGPRGEFLREIGKGRYAWS